MTTRKFATFAATAALAGAALMGAGAAQARSDVAFSIGIAAPGVGVTVGNYAPAYVAPVYYAPPPVVYAPAPVYYAPQPVVYARPAPVVYRPAVVVAPAYYGYGYRPHHHHGGHWER